MKELYLIRHAEADSPLGLPDFDRPLSANGRAAAENLARTQAKVLVNAEAVYASAAIRTMQTAQIVAQTAGLWAEVQSERFMYMAQSEQILDWLSAQADDLGTVLIVGHNPTMYEVVRHLGVRIPGFPKAGMVAMRFNTKHWADIGPENRVAERISFAP